MASSASLESGVTISASLSPTFTPEPSCIRDIYFVPAVGQNCVAGTVPVPCRYFHLGAPSSTSSECFPSGWSPSTKSYISPGACPASYTIACADTGGSQTVATCCPDDGSGGAYTCVSSLYFEYLSTDRCSRIVPSTIDFVYTTSTLGQSGFSVETNSNAAQVLYAYGMEIRWESSDLVTPTSSSSTKSASRTASTAAVESGSGQAAPSHGLSNGAKAGIAVGVVLAALTFLLGIAIFWKKRRSLRQAGPPPSMNPEAKPAFEVDSQPVAELHGNDRY